MISASEIDALVSGSKLRDWKSDPKANARVMERHKKIIREILPEAEPWPREASGKRCRRPPVNLPPLTEAELGPEEKLPGDVRVSSTLYKALRTARCAAGLSREDAGRMLGTDGEAVRLLESARAGRWDKSFLLRAVRLYRARIIQRLNAAKHEIATSTLE